MSGIADRIVGITIPQNVYLVDLKFRILRGISRHAMVNRQRNIPCHKVVNNVVQLL
jgi:hypothetical protein